MHSSKHCINATKNIPQTVHNYGTLKAPS